MTATVKIYFGKTSDVSASSGSTTFIFYDSLANLAQWTTFLATSDGNVMNLPAGAYAMTTSTFDTRNTAFRCRIFLGSGSDWEKYFGWSGNTNYYYAPDNGCGLWNDYGPSSRYQRLQYGSGQGGTVPLPAAQWDVYDMYLNSAGSTAYVYKNGVMILSGSVSCNQLQKWMISDYWPCGGTYQLDWLIVRKKTNNEPSHGGWSG